MKKRILIQFVVALIFLIGLAMMPLSVLAFNEPINWKMFSKAYVYDPQVSSDYYAGGAGSVFMITGEGFPPYDELHVEFNEDGGWYFATDTDSYGNFTIAASSEFLSPGMYGGVKLTFSTGDEFDSLTLLIVPCAPVHTTVFEGFPIWIQDHNIVPGFSCNFVPAIQK